MHAVDESSGSVGERMGSAQCSDGAGGWKSAGEYRAVGSANRKLGLGLWRLKARRQSKEEKLGMAGQAGRLGD